MQAHETFEGLLPLREDLALALRAAAQQGLSEGVSKHLSDEHKGKSGIPDLFLFATSHSTGLPTIARFVEVEKPEEAVSSVQMAEIAILNQMGLHARVLRLVERE
jgi:hypothetical protein